MNKENVWIEKHRPETLDEIVGQDETIHAIKNRLDNLPHMIFDGPAGTGKTTCAKCIAIELGCDFKTINSSEERGIEVVRHKITDFARHLGFTHASYKILFLDEADGITSDAQDAMKSLIEKYSHNCRFMLGCNNIDKIIQPIKSRCKIFRFRPVDKDSMVKRLRFIAEQENVFISMSEQDKDNALEELAERARGDMRRAINDLQMGDYGTSEVGQIFSL